jgi:hypothetical protein
VSEPFDSSDLDAIEDLKRSRGYELVCSKLDEEIGRYQRSLETDLEPAQTAGCRGYIRALRMVLTLPQILHEEIAAELKE